MLATKIKQKIIEQYKIHDKDTGSPEVQVGILSKKIEELTEHLKKHKKDNHSRLGLLKMVADRRTLMNYLSNKNKTRHVSLAKKLDLKVKSEEDKVKSRKTVKSGAKKAKKNN